MVTEPVVPVTDTLDEMCVEGVVTGWRGVAQGLSFLHQKVSYAAPYTHVLIQSYSHTVIQSYSRHAHTVTVLL